MPGLARLSMLFCALLLTTADLRAQTFSWINGAGGTFGTAGNWSPAGPPSTTAHTAVFNVSGGNYAVSMGANHTVGTFNVGSLQNAMTFNMLGRTFTPTARMDIAGTLNISGGGAVGTTSTSTTVRNFASLNVGTGTTFRSGSFTIGALPNGANSTFTAATLTTSGTALGSEDRAGLLSLKSGSVGTFGFLDVGSPGQAGSGFLEVFTNSSLNVGTLQLGAQGTITNNASITVNTGGRITMLAGSPLTIGGSTTEFLFAPPPFPSTINRGGILTLNTGTIGGTGGTFTTSNALTTVNYGGLIDIQSGTFVANGTVINNGFIVNSAAGNFIAPITQTTVIDSMFSGAPVGSLVLGFAPGLENYGRMTGGTLIIGSATSSNGWAVVSSPSVSLDRAVIVGGAGAGRLDAGLMNVPALVIGQSSGSNGVVNVGTFSVGSLGTSTLNSGTLSATANTTVGNSGNGTLRIEASSLFTTIASTTVGSGGGSHGTLVLSGTGTVLPARFEAPANRLTIGNNGRGTLLIGGNSSLNVATLLVGPAPLTGVGFGTVLQSGGTVSSGSLLSVNPTGYYAMSGGTITSAISNAGTFVYSGGAFLQPIGNTGTTVIDGALPAGSVINNEPTGRILAPSGLFAGAGTINNAGSFGGVGTVAAGMTLHNTGTLGSLGDDFVIENGVTFTNAAGSLIRNAQLSTLRLRTFLDNAGNVEVNAGGGVETGFSLNILTGQKLTLKGGLLSIGNAVVGDNLSIFPGATVVGFGQINASMYNSGSTQFNGPTQIVGLFQNDAAVNVRNATTIVYGTATNNGSITTSAGGTIIFDSTLAVAGPESAAGGLDGTGTLAISPGGAAVASYIRQDTLRLDGSPAELARVSIRSTSVGGDVSRVRSLSIAGSPGNFFGRLDLTDTALVLDYTGASPINGIRALLTSGFAGGSWNGAGINSSIAASTPNRALGFAEATDIGSPATFAGQPIDSTSILVRFTLPGDADLSGNVDLDDFTRLAANFGLASTWSSGDFNYDAITNLDDFTALAANFGFTLPAAAPARGGTDSAVPEPAMIAIALLPAILRRRRGRHC